MIKSIKNDFYSFKKEILNNKYWFLILICSLTAYGFNLFNRTVSMDDLAYSYFLNKDHAMIAGMRWGLELLNPILPSEYTPFICRFYSLIGMIVCAILLSFYFYLIDGKRNNYAYIILSCLFLTYPLINESWEFFSFLYYPLFIAMIVFSLVLWHYNPNSFKTKALMGLILSPVLAGGEDAIVVYIVLVFISLYQRKRNGMKDNWFLTGLSLTIPLFIGLVFREIIGFALIFIMGLKYSPVGNYNVVWFSEGFKGGLLGVLYNGWYYLARAFSYFPIGEFAIALIIHLIISIKDSIKNKNGSYLLMSLLMILSLFSLSIIQGEYLHYRNAQPLFVYIGYIGYLLVTESINYKKVVHSAVVVLLLFVCLRQSVNLHELLALENQRSDNEMAVFRNIGYRLYSEYDTTKTVIFCGEYQLGSFIEDQIVVKEGSLGEKIEDYLREVTGKERGRLYQEFVCTDINSYYNTQYDAFSGQIMIKNYLSYLGYDINVLENLTSEEEDEMKYKYEEIAIKEEMKPYDIKDMEDYILVFMGPTIDGINAD